MAYSQRDLQCLYRSVLDLGLLVVESRSTLLLEDHDNEDPGTVWTGSLPVDHHFYEEDNRPRTVLPDSVSLSDLEKSGAPSHADSAVRTCSRLSKTLHEILHDKDALPYFIQYMDAQRAGQLVRFWLDAQSFQVSAMTRVRSRSFNQERRRGRGEEESDQWSSGEHRNTNNSASVGGSTGVGEEVRRMPSAAECSGQTKVTHTFPLQNTERLCDIPQCKDTLLPSDGVHSNRVVMQPSPRQPGCDGNLPVSGSNPSDPVDSSSSSDVRHSTAASSRDSSLSAPSIHSSVSLPSGGATSNSMTNNNSAHGGSLSENTLPSPVHGPGSCDAANANTRNTCDKNMQARSAGAGVSGESTSHGSASSSSVDTTNQTPGNQHIRTTGSSQIGQNSVDSGRVGAQGQNQGQNDTDDSTEGAKPRVGEGVLSVEGKVDTQEAGSKAHTGGPHTTAVGDKRRNSKVSIQDKLLQSIAQDAVRMFSKYIALEATHPIGVTEELRAETIRKICSEDGQVDPGSFEACQELVVTRMQEDYHGDFLLSCFHCKHQFDVLSTSQVYLADFIYNDTAFSYLTEYMEQESSLPLLQCFLDLDAFQQLLVSRLGQYDGMEAQSDAMVIYDKYFSMQATRPLGFPDCVRLEVEEKICREGGPLPDCFCRAKGLVLRALDKHYFPGFTHSDVYFKYMADLMNTVQSADIPTGATRKRKESDAVSTHSDHSGQSAGAETSTKNTLLAAGTSHVIRQALHKMEDNMQIDGALLNPDSLWRRPGAGSMSLGKVDELGRFVSELELEPDGEKPKLGFLKKRKEKEQTQEQMAAQIAMRIVSGITANTQVEARSTELSANLPQ